MIDLSRLKDMLEHIPCADLDYQNWLSVGAALHKEGLPCALWTEWSAKDTGRYHAGECERKWKTFGHYTGPEVSIGTIYHLAQEYGWEPESMKTYGWDDYITVDDDPAIGWHKSTTVMTIPGLPDDYSPVNDIREYLSAMFKPDEHVRFVTTAFQDDEGKWKPYGGIGSKTCKELLNSLADPRHKDDPIGETFGTPNAEAGVWIGFNPMNGSDFTNRGVTDYRYSLIEGDIQDIDTQYAILQDLKLPIRMLVHSGGKSLHAIVKVDAVSEDQYKERVNYLYTVCEKFGFNVDRQNKNSARLSRFPGFRRKGKWQYIVGRNLGLSSWDEWHQYIENEIVPPLPVVNLADIWDNMPPLKPVLIDGILRQGHKMMLSSSSKAGKTFAMIELAIAIAEGGRWMGFDCRQGRVLYLNMELDEASFDDRMKRVYGKLNLREKHPTNIDIVHLRGRIETMDKLVPQIVRTLQTKDYVAVILDPIYKLGIGDENAADQVAQFCNSIDKIANAGVSVIYAHHHSKGDQGGKSSMDRASGSGVFARDADAILDMIELRIPDELAQEARQIYGDSVTAWRLDSVLREFQRCDPINMFFAYPIHIEDDHGILDEARLEEVDRKLDYGRGKGSVANKMNRIEREDKLAEMIEQDRRNGTTRTDKEYAQQLHVNERSVRNYKKSIEDRKKAETSVYI